LNYARALRSYYTDKNIRDGVLPVYLQPEPEREGRNDTPPPYTPPLIVPLSPPDVVPKVSLFFF
jgi:hypothetical protein